MTKNAEAKILFGTAGTPESAEESTMAGMREIARIKLDTMELEFVQGVRLGRPKAEEIGALARELNMPLSCHAPYYVNLAAKEPQKIEDSIKRIMDSARIGAICGVDNVIFHAGFFMGRDAETVYAMIRDNMLRIREMLDAEGLKGVTLRPELTGKPSAFGSPEELFRLCRDVPGALPCIDFSHMFARTQGEFNSYDDFCRLLEAQGKSLGDKSLKNFHAHLSGIEYTAAGEKRHLNVKDSKIKYRDVLKALSAMGVQGRVICESPDRAHDAGVFKKYWNRCLVEKAGGAECEV